MSDEPVLPGRTARRLPTVRLGFPKQLEVLRAFAVLGVGGAPVHYSKVADTVQAHESNVSMMNPFFVENGFIVKSGAGHVPAPEVVEFGRMWGWNKETAPGALAPLMRRTWFAEALLNRILFRPLGDEEAVEILAAACGADPSARPQLRTLLDYLAAAGLVRRENGQLSAVTVAEAQPSVAVEAPEKPATVLTPQAVIAPPGAGNISFQVNVSVNMAELAGWPADRITAFFAGVAQVIAARGASES